MKKHLLTLIAAFAVVALWTTPVRAAEGMAGGDAKEHAEHAAEKGKAPTSYAAALTAIDEHLAAIDGLIKGKKLDDVHHEAQAIVDLSKTLATLALKADSGVPKEAVKDINKTAKELAGKFDAIDKAGDAGDEAGTRKVLDEMIALQATLKKYAPTVAAVGDHAHTYACKMGCEGDKTYDAPGKCPKCGMNLAEVTPPKTAATKTDLPKDAPDTK